MGSFTFLVSARTSHYAHSRKPEAEIDWAKVDDGATATKSPTEKNPLKWDINSLLLLPRLRIGTTVTNYPMKCRRPWWHRPKKTNIPIFLPRILAHRSEFLLFTEVVRHTRRLCWDINCFRLILPKSS